MKLGKEFLEACAIDDNPAFSIVEIAEILENQKLRELLEKIDWRYLNDCLRVGINASYDGFKNGGKDPEEFVKLIADVLELQKLLGKSKK